MKNELTTSPLCLHRSSGRNWAQESYETSSRGAGRRARELRKLGYRVSVSGMGPQITDMGWITLTLVSIDTTPEAPELPPYPANVRY
jgi:hypothetical protein